LINNLRQWSRVEAEHRISEVLDKAKAGATQTIGAVDGTWEIRFTPSSLKESAGQALARGGPVED